MKINFEFASPIKNQRKITPSFNQKKDVNFSSNFKNFNQGLNCLANYNIANISFKGSYNGDLNPAKKLFWIVTGRNKIYRDEDINNSAWKVQTNSGQKAWSTIHPKDLLKRNIEQAIQGICTLNDTYEIPDYIQTPNYGDNWGRRANYIEINPRLIAKIQGTEISDGLMNMIKLLPAIPPSTTNIPNCVILSQLFPTKGNWHDGQTGDIGIYCLDLENGYSKGLISSNLERDGVSMSDVEQIKAFNDLAHFRGLKTGLRMPVSAGQMNVGWGSFSWQDNVENYINACCDAVNLGFDAIYLDSGKHIGWWDMENYCGCGDVPDYETMQYITYEIRRRTNRSDISIIAEKADTNPRFENLGYTAGTDWGCADNQDSLWHEYHNQQHNSNYAAGPCISDDNDNGIMTYEQRLARLKNSFNSFDDSYKKLPVHLQMHDIFPLKEDLNTHQTMMESSNRSKDGSVDSHYDNIFATSDAANNQRINMYREFEKIMNK